MKSVREMTRLELAGFVADAFRIRNINVVLSGGSCVSIYSQEKYVSMDLDFVNAGFAKRAQITETMEALGFKEEKRYFRHPDAQVFIEFPPGPLGVGQEPVKRVDEVETTTGVLRIISPTDCVKDRLAWYYHAGDTECLGQAVLVCCCKDVDLAEVERWSRKEGKSQEFGKFRKALTSATAKKNPS